MSGYYFYSHLFFFHKHFKLLCDHDCTEIESWLAIGCLIIILILISFPFHKHFRLGNIFLSSNQLFFSSQMITLNFYASNKLGESLSIP